MDRPEKGGRAEVLLKDSPSLPSWSEGFHWTLTLHTRIIIWRVVVAHELRHPGPPAPRF